MILTDKELDLVRESIETQAGLDEELFRRCSHLIHMGAFDEAVRSAFVLLEERLKEAVNKEGMTGTQVANYAFNPTDGPLSKHLGRNPSEREGLRELYSGAFKLFRNPSAHGTVGYDASDGKAIIGMVNLMLNMIKRTKELPAPDLFPDNVEKAIRFHEEKIGPGAASRLRMFIGKSLKLGLQPVTTAKQWIPFKRHGLVKFDQWEKPRPHSVAVFYLSGESTEKALYIPTDYYYAKIVDFNADLYTEEFLELGFRRIGKNQELYVDLRIYNDEKFFSACYSLISRIIENLEETLAH